MKEKLQFVRLPILLFVIFFVGRLALGAAMGVSKPTYDLANRLFSMVIFQVHVGLLWGAVGRKYRGYGIGGSIMAVVLVTILSQALIFAGTALLYVAHVDTLFTFPEALNSTAPVPFAEALVRRTATFVTNCVLIGIMGSIGWMLGRFLPGGVGTTEKREAAVM